MFNTKYKLINLYPSEKSIRLLTSKEKENITNFVLKTISIDDEICKFLEAEIDDVICIRFTTTDIYRRVISKKIDN